MLIAFTARDIVQVFIIGFSALALLHLLWPRILARSIQWKSQGNWLGGLLYRHVGFVLVGLGAVFALALFTGFVYWDDERSWTDTEPALTSLAIVAGVVFGYMKLFPPPFWPAYHLVDQRTGDWDNEKVEEVTIPSGKEVGIFLAIHNTGIAPWNNYRITVQFEEGYVLTDESPSVPASFGWGWKTRGLRFIHERSTVQIQAGNTLAVGEPQTLRFVLTNPGRTGKSKVRVFLVCDGRLSESSRELWLNVLD